jgi:hypothetical protein
MELQQPQARVVQLEPTQPGLLTLFLCSNFKFDILIGYQIGIAASSDRTVTVESLAQTGIWEEETLNLERYAAAARTLGLNTTVLRVVFARSLPLGVYSRRPLSCPAGLHDFSSRHVLESPCPDQDVLLVGSFCSSILTSPNPQERQHQSKYSASYPPQHYLARSKYSITHHVASNTVLPTTIVGVDRPTASSPRLSEHCVIFVQRFQVSAVPSLTSPPFLCRYLPWATR